MNEPEPAGRISKSADPAFLLDGIDTRAYLVTELVVFSGFWEEDDVRLIEATAAALDEHAPFHGVDDFGKPWVCDRHQLAGRTFYFAQWTGQLETVLRASTSEQLAGRMWKLVFSSQ